MRMILGDVRLASRASFNWIRMTQLVRKQYLLVNGARAGHIHLEAAKLLDDKKTLRLSGRLPGDMGNVNMDVPKADWRWAPRVLN